MHLRRTSEPRTQVTGPPPGITIPQWIMMIRTVEHGSPGNKSLIYN